MQTPIQQTTPLALLHISNYLKMSNNVGDGQLHLGQAGGLPLSEAISKMEHINIASNSIATAEAPDARASCINTSETNPLSFSS